MNTFRVSRRAWALLFSSFLFVFTASAQIGHTLVAYYTFDQNTGVYQADSSGNNNFINTGSFWGNNANLVFSTNAIAGGGALLFDGGENIGESSPPGNQTFDNWLAVFYDSFTVSVWINTTNKVGSDGDDLGCCSGATVIDGYYGGVSDVIPLGLTGSKAAFYTSDPTGTNSDTLHSATSVTTGQYVHVVVSWDQPTGVKKIYINGALDASDVGTTNHLDGDTSGYNIGGFFFSSYAGLVDDVQLYSGVLDSDEVAYLHAHPGQTVPNTARDPLAPQAFYDFDEETPLAADLTANGNDLVYPGNFSGPVLTNDSISGSGAVYFNGASFLTPSSNLLSTIAGDFSLSLWLKSTQSQGWDTAPAYYGAGIFAADAPGTTNDLVPMALTGGTIGFNTGSVNGDDTLNSAGDINDGNYHHVVVTRDRATGVKQIFVDGTLNTNEAGNTELLNAPQLITIGALADASNPDPTSPQYSGYNGFIGEIDDIQLYSRVLAASEVAFLNAHPGQNATNGLVAHYDFDEGTVLARDVSGHGNDMMFAGTLEFYGTGPDMSTNGEAGGGAISFDGSAYLVPAGEIVTNLAQDFSLSVWLNTTQSMGTAGQPATAGAGVVTAETPDQVYDLTPLALVEGRPAFETDGGSHDTLTATIGINDGNYHHVVVTRQQSSGQKQIFIDGVLNNSDTDDGSVLSFSQLVIFGAFADASQSDPYSPSLDGYNGYVGLMDSAQIYSRVLSSAEVAYLYENPDATLSSGGGSTNNDNLGLALGAPSLSWTTSGDADWFVESTNTYSTNAAAAQSGPIGDNQSSIMQTTVQGPGIVSFYWESLAGNGDDFDLEFDIDNNYEDDISGQIPWVQESLPVAGAGSHVLTWYANTQLDENGSSPSDAGFVDQFVFTPAVAPVITINPFSQTNYPGYSVALLAAATGTPAPVWQWYEVGNPNPIPGATSALFIPTNSGAPGVAGSYYAVAINIAGAVATTPAQVTFVNAPTPPDWTSAIKSPFNNSDLHGMYVANDVFHDCVVDSTGSNIYAVGFTGGTNFFGTNEILAVNNDLAGFVVKEDTSGNGLWLAAVTNNGHGNAYGENIAPAPNGGIYATIGFSGTNWIGNTLLQDSGVGSIYLARLDSNGNILWSQTITASAGAFPVLGSMASDPAGNVTLAGVASGSVTIGGTNLSISGQTSFLAQFNSSGSVNWAERVANITEPIVYSGGRIYACLNNWLSGNTNYTVGGLTNDLGRNFTLAAINATNGQGIWLRDIGEPFGTFPTGDLVDDTPLLAVSGSNIFLVGISYSTNAVFGSYTVPISGGRGQYFARYDTNGNAQLATGFGSTTTQPEAAVADASGNVYVAGNFDTYSFFGQDIIAAPRLGSNGPGYNGQGFTAMFDRNGNAQWARTVVATNFTIIPDTDFVTLWNLALAPNGLWVCGEGDGVVDFGDNFIDSGRIFVDIGENVYVDFYESGVLGYIALSQPVTPVTIVNPLLAGTNFEFSFVSTLNHTNIVQSTTNLASKNWSTYTNIVGDGTSKTIVVPAKNPATQYFRVNTQ